MSSPPDSGGIRISLEAIYDQLIRVAARVDAVLSKLERHDEAIAQHESELRPLAGAAERLLDHEARLRQLERSRWPVTSVTVLIGLASVAVAVFAVLYSR